MVVSGAIEPRVAYVRSHVDDERLSLPVGPRMSHPRFDGRLEIRTVQINDPARARELVGDQYGLGRLDNLERVGHIGGARHARHVALHGRVALEPMLEIVLLLRPRLGSVGDLAALYDAEPAGHGTKRGELDDGPHARGMRLDVPVGRAESLPDPIQVRFAVGCPWRPVL